MRASHPDSSSIKFSNTCDIEKIARRHAWNVVDELGLQPDERRDIQQELHLALWLRLKKYDPNRGTLKTFLERVAKNESRKLVAYRKARRRWPGYTVDQNDQLSGREDKMNLRIDTKRAIQLLPSRLRRVALALKEYSCSEAVVLLGISKATLYRLLTSLKNSPDVLALREYVD